MSDDETTRVRMPDVVIEDALGAIFDDLAELPTTPKTREMLARAEAYRRAFEGWAHTKPNQGQREALRDLVLELHGRTRAMRHEIDMAETPVEGVPLMRTPSGPPSGRRR